MEPNPRKGIIRLLLFFLLLSASFKTFAVEVPVLLRLTAQEQKDTTGCNFVYELCSLMHDEIMAGKLELWDSPARDLKISASSLKAISDASGTALNARGNQLVYIYEFWNDERGELKSRTQGFLLTARDAQGKEISFGYVDYSAAESICMRYRVKTNVNGDYNATAASYVSSKNFNFNIIQFNGNVVSGVKESEEILSAYVKGRAFNTQHNGLNEVKLKLVSYTLEPETGTTEGMQAKRILSSVDSFFHANEELIFNHIDDSVSEKLQGKKWKVTRMDIREIWRKEGESVTSSLVGITLYVSHRELPEWPFRSLSAIDHSIDGLTLLATLEQKTFAHRLLSINEEQISRGDALLYRKALRESAWNRLSDYVKYY